MTVQDLINSLSKQSPQAQAVIVVDGTGYTIAGVEAGDGIADDEVWIVTDEEIEDPA